MTRMTDPTATLRLGAHTSISGGVFNALEEGVEIGADVVQIFSKSQRQWSGRAYRDDELERYDERRRSSGVEPVVIHNSYLINLGSPKEDVFRKSHLAMIDELNRAAVLKVPYLLMHPGSHLGDGEAAGIARIAEGIDRCLEEADAPEVTLLLEATAGQGTNLGYRFEHLRDIMAASRHPERLGVCIDTCHIFAAGYDMRDAAAWEATRQEFDAVVGLAHLRLFHLNDSQHALGSRKDRHARLGDGDIGFEGFAVLVRDPAVRHLPMILEVPGGLPAYREDLARLRDAAI